jgi:hypothetical protein
VNLSLAWSKWKTVLLDDPVQHVDDFRSIQLTEVMGQLIAGGRQIICAVEDAALADLLCRRLPINQQGDGKRVTLGPALDGSPTKLQEHDLSPLPQQSLVTTLNFSPGRAMFFQAAAGGQNRIAGRFAGRSRGLNMEMGRRGACPQSDR